MLQHFLCPTVLILLLLIALLPFSANAHFKEDPKTIDKEEFDRIYDYSVRIAEQNAKAIISSNQPELPTVDLKQTTIATVAGDGTCYSELRPEPVEAFLCEAGALWATSSLDVPDVTIPNTLVSFRSNLMISNSLRFGGQKSKIEVAGCFSPNPALKVSLSFTPLEVDLFHYLKIDEYRTLSIIEQKGSNCPPIPELKISAVESPSTCKELSLEILHEANSIGVRVRIHHTKCMAGSWVIPGVVLVFVIAAIVSLVTLRCKRSRT